MYSPCGGHIQLFSTRSGCVFHIYICTTVTHSTISHKYHPYRFILHATRAFPQIYVLYSTDLPYVHDNIDDRDGGKHRDIEPVRSSVCGIAVLLMSTTTQQRRLRKEKKTQTPLRIADHPL